MEMAGLRLWTTSAPTSEKETQSVQDLRKPEEANNREKPGGVFDTLADSLAMGVFLQLFLECPPPPKPQAEVSATCQHGTLSDRLCARSLPGAALGQSRTLQPPTVTSCPMVPSFLRSLESLYLASSLLCSWSTVRGVLSTGVCASFVRTFFLIRSLLLSERAHHVHGDPSFFRDRFASVHDVVLHSLIPNDISSPSQTEMIAAFGQLRHQRNVRLLR